MCCRVHSDHFHRCVRAHRGREATTITFMVIDRGRVCIHGLDPCSLSGVHGCRCSSLFQWSLDRCVMGHAVVVRYDGEWCDEPHQIDSHAVKQSAWSYGSYHTYSNITPTSQYPTLDMF